MNDLWKRFWDSLRPYPGNESSMRAMARARASPGTRSPAAGRSAVASALRLKRARPARIAPASAVSPASCAKNGP